MKKQFEQLQPMIEFVNSFDAPENLKTILDFLKEGFLFDSAEGRLRPLETEVSPFIAEKLNEIAKDKGITQKEALNLLLKDNLKTVSNAEDAFRKLEKRSRRTARTRKTQK
jgi:hypothetical protein